MFYLTTLRRFRSRSILLVVTCLLLPAVSVSAQTPRLAPTLDSEQTEPLPQGEVRKTPATESSNAASRALDVDYILGPGDQLALAVLGYEDFTNISATPQTNRPTQGSLVQDILPDGTITLPLIGSVRASGKTLNALKQEITTKLETYLVNPVVTLSLINLKPVRVIVGGQVERPGPIQLANLSNTRDQAATTTAPTLTSALATAGGVSRDADLRRVVLKRMMPDGEVKTVTLNLWEIIALESGPQDPIILRDGDSIFVPKLEVGNPVDSRLVAKSSFAPATVRVRVVGEVKAPGVVQIRPDSSISGAIAAAGGPTVDAKLSNTGFVRMNPKGQIETKQLNLHGLSDNMQIQEGDVIVVPRTTFASVLDYMGRLLGPAAFFSNLFR